MVATLDILKLTRKLPGFRSGVWWKKIIASTFYGFILLVLLAIVIPTAPTLALEKIEPTNQSSVSISGKTSPNKPVYLLQEGEVIQESKADSKGKFIFALNNLTDGGHSYTVEACRSAVKDKCTSENILISVDRTAPNAPLIALPKDLPEREGDEVVITGKAEPDTQIIAQLGDQNLPEVSVDEDGNFEIKTGLVLGVNTFSVKAVDAVGNQSQVYSSEIDYQPKQQKVKVTRVVDGDTVELENSEKVRYIGVDTPETYECYYSEAKDKNKDLVEGEEVYLEKDVSETDRYGRLLRYVWVGNTFVNDNLVAEGYAQVATYPPDIKYQKLFVATQETAQKDEKGLWSETCHPKDVLGTTTSTSTPAPTQKTTTTQQQSAQIITPSGSTCNCSKTCSQMSSCDEAYFQLNTCGCSARDGDGDGVPCEDICPGGDSQAAPPPPAPQPPSQPQVGGFSCNCSKTCDQMACCDEAYFQLNQCGCSRRDGDNDGVPCESICQ